MKWFSALVVTRSLVGEDDHEPLFMRTVFLIEAHDKNDAQNKAEQLGQNSETEYLNCDQEIVKWELVEIIEVQEIESFEHGVELHSYLNRS